MDGFGNLLRKIAVDVGVPDEYIVSTRSATIPNIRSVCEPFDLEMELELKKVENWLAHFDLHPYTHIHASGHLNYDEMQDVVETVQPKILIPLHTQHI
jgi:mRNA degradation ribonuclease J1/J2